MRQVVDLTIEDIYNQYFKEIYSFCIYSINNREEAEDITHDTFIKIMNNLHTLKDPTKIRAWVFQIARTTLIDYQRRKKLKQFISGDTLLEKFSSSQKTPEERLLNKNTWELVQKALLKLKVTQRDVFLLRTIHEFSVTETAQILNCSEGKVRVDHHRSLKRIQEILTEFTGKDEVGYESS